MSDETADRHGYTAYTNGCRCQICTDAKAAYMRDRRAKAARRRELVTATGSGGRNYVDGIVHGHNGYQNHSCRCDECRRGHSERDRRIREPGRNIAYETARAGLSDPLVAEIFRLRGERGWTLRELAGRAGIAPASISAVEHGHNGYSVYTLRRLAAVFGLEVWLQPIETKQDRRRRQWREYKQRRRAVDNSVEEVGAA